MSWSERSVRYHKQQTDRAIRRAYARLATDFAASEKFRELLYCARRRAPRLMEAPFYNGHHPGVDALLNLSRFRSAHIRPAAHWVGTMASWQLTVASLASHLVCRYEVPMFLASSWYSREEATGDRKRGWFLSHSGGASFRSLDLPIAMTRRMERIFLASSDHFSIEYAIRRAELIALGARTAFVHAVLSTRMATDLSNGIFWRTVWQFLITNAVDIDPSQIGPMIDFIQAIRHERIAMDTPEGTVEMDPPQPAFSMKGRSVPSILRLMVEWHRTLGLGSSGLTWTPSPLRPMTVEEPNPDTSLPPRRWQIVELTNSAQLRMEGSALRHCVASYAESCKRGTSRIFSLRFRQGEKTHHSLTIEVDPRTRAIVQARGRGNRLASRKPLRLLQEWALREGLRIAV